MATAVDDVPIEEIEAGTEETVSEVTGTPRTRLVETFAATNFRDMGRGKDRSVVSGRWASNAALIRVTSGSWKIVIGVRKARSEDKTVVRCAPSTRSPSSQVHVVDEDWLFDGKNVDKVVFGFIGGRFSSRRTHGRS